MDEMNNDQVMGTEGEMEETSAPEETMGDEGASEDTSEATEETGAMDA